jgi:flagellar motility protein MotE (MotC chaperone)
MKKKQQTPSRRSDVRLLPAVIGTGVILLGLKAAGLAFSANAATPAAAAQPAAAAKPAIAPTNAAGAKPPAPADPLAAINAALPVPPKTAKSAEAPKPADELNPDAAVSAVSSAEMDVLTSLADRRDVLEKRQRDLDLRANIITATEKRVDDKIAQLKTLQARIEALLGQRDAKELEQLDGLVKVYTAMKPKDAARIFSALDDSVRLGVAGRMKPDVIAGIMSSLPAEVAQKITVQLASRYKVPADTGASIAAAAAAASNAASAATPGATTTPPANAPAPAAAAPSNAAAKPAGG